LFISKIIAVVAKHINDSTTRFLKRKSHAEMKNVSKIAKEIIVFIG